MRDTPTRTDESPPIGDFILAETLVQNGTGGGNGTASGTFYTRQAEAALGTFIPGSTRFTAGCIPSGNVRGMREPPARSGSPVFLAFEGAEVIHLHTEGSLTIPTTCIKRT